MTEKAPAPEVAPAPPKAKAKAPAPHDRDETAQAPIENAQHDHNRKPIGQAHADVESGLKDTERIGTPNDIPTSSQNRG